MYIVDHFTSNYGSDAAITAMMDQTELIVIPVVNIDGYAFTWTNNRLWRKSRNTNLGSSCTGTDLNRNYNDRWDSGIGTSSNPCSSIFKGASPGSEPEIAATTTYFKNI